MLLTTEKNAREKKEILEKDFDIPMTEKLEGEVEQMCNLSDGVEQKGIQKGTLATLCDLVRDNLLPLEEAAKRAGISIEEFQKEVMGSSGK